MRCYNGCPDSKLQAILDQQAADDRALKQTHPQAHCTLHYGEGYQVHIWGKPYGILSPVRSVAIASGIAALKTAFRPAGGGVSPGGET